MAIVELPVEVGGITLLQQFWVVRDFPYNLIGAPWLKDTGAIIDCQKQLATLRVGNEEVCIGIYEGTYPPPSVFMVAPQ